jgi:pimeloyl-ACP methyl ester carboxylesterase
VDDARLRVCLERSVELSVVCLRVRDWPGRGGPIVHLPDPFGASPLIVELASALAPRYRVLSLEPRADVSYVDDASDLASFLRVFGFEHAVLVAEGVGCAAARVVAAWHPELLAGLVLVEPRYTADAAGLRGRGLRDCRLDIGPPSVPLLELAELEAFLATLEAPR